MIVVEEELVIVVDEELVVCDEVDEVDEMELLPVN